MTSESPRAHAAKFYGKLRLLRSILRASKFAVLKLIEILMLWVYNPSPLALTCLGTFVASFATFLLNYFLAKGSLTKVQYPKCAYCPCLRRSLFLYFNHFVSVTAGGQVSSRGHMKPSSTVEFG